MHEKNTDRYAKASERFLISYLKHMYLGIYENHQTETKSKMDSDFHSIRVKPANVLLLIHNSFCCFYREGKKISELKMFLSNKFFFWGEEECFGSVDCLRQIQELREKVINGFTFDGDLRPRAAMLSSASWSPFEVWKHLIAANKDVPNDL